MKPRTSSLAAFTSIAILALALAGACGGTTPEADHEHQHESHEGDMAEPVADGAEPLEPISLGAGQKLKVVATTNIVGDVVSQVGGGYIELTTLMSAGVDPHSYVPTPADAAAIHDAHVVFANGAGLEADLEEMFESAGGEAVHIHVSHGLEHREVGSDDDEAEQGLDHDHGAVDPHVWFDVQNVIHWVETIEHTLGTLDPDNAEFYGANAQAYVHDLEELDLWVVEQVATIPEANRKLVTSHPVFGYFSERYGLEQLGAVYPISPSSEPSAQDIAVLEDAILQYGVPAVFAESTVNPKLAEQVAKDTGVELVALYTGSLGDQGSGAESYVLLMRYDVSAIVDALK
jgi:ABC-type Zn uptake system ZnuABC Zn-binding protein ZnuA